MTLKTQSSIPTIPEPQIGEQVEQPSWAREQNGSPIHIGMITDTRTGITITLKNGERKIGVSKTNLSPKRREGGQVVWSYDE